MQTARDDSRSEVPEPGKGMSQKLDSKGRRPVKAMDRKMQGMRGKSTFTVGKLKRLRKGIKENH